MAWYKEALKFISGAFFWDGVVAVWALVTKMYSIKIFGITFTAGWLIGVLIFDFIVSAVLAYLAWFGKKPETAGTSTAPSVPSSTTPPVPAVAKAPAAPTTAPAKTAAVTTTTTTKQTKTARKTPAVKAAK